MEFRAIKESDCSQLFDIERECFTDPWQYGDLMSAILSDNGFGYCATEGDRIISYLIGTQIAPEGEIYRVATTKSARRCSYAKKLIEYAIPLEKEKGLKTLYLEVRSHNTPAIALYSSLGFEKIATRKGYYRNPTDDAIIMTLNV